jgi:mitochondrial fission protein ELM1
MSGSDRGEAGAAVWVLEDPHSGTTASALGIAERLEVPFRRIELVWNWMAPVAGLAPHGSLIGLSPLPRLAEQGAPAFATAAPTQVLAPAPGGTAPRLVVSAGARSAAVALWLKARFGSRLVHCLGLGLSSRLRAPACDLLVQSTHDHPFASDNVFPVLGVPHRISPLALREAGAVWEERLAYLPRPRVVLLVGGPTWATEMPPAMAHALGRKVARLASRAGGSVLASTSRRTGGEASDALAAGLGRAMHLLYRWGEPDESPYRGFLAAADVIVVTTESAPKLSEACGTTAPVYAALPELAGLRQRRLLAAMMQAGQVRPLRDSIAPFARTALDEAGRVAAEIRRRFPPD